MEDEEQRQEEVEALEAIYGDDFSRTAVVPPPNQGISRCNSPRARCAMSHLHGISSSGPPRYPEHRGDAKASPDQDSISPSLQPCKALGGF